MLETFQTYWSEHSNSGKWSVGRVIVNGRNKIQYKCNINVHENRNIQYPKFLGCWTILVTYRIKWEKTRRSWDTIWGSDRQGRWGQQIWELGTRSGLFSKNRVSGCILHILLQIIWSISKRVKYSTVCSCSETCWNQRLQNWRQ